MGWGQLAWNYKYFLRLIGIENRFTSCKIGKIHYFKLCTVKIVDKGLYIRLPFLFKLMHSLLLIPWGDIVVGGEVKGFGMSALQLTVKDQRIQIPYKLYLKVEEYKEKNLNTKLQ